MRGTLPPSAESLAASVGWAEAERALVAKHKHTLTSTRRMCRMLRTTASSTDRLNSVLAARRQPGRLQHAWAARQGLLAHGFERSLPLRPFRSRASSRRAERALCWRCSVEMKVILIFSRRRNLRFLSCQGAPGSSALG
jgi:hypothetical protein